jgi:hypothetical protein
MLINLLICCLLKGRAHAVLQTPLIPSVHDDKVVWQEEWNGLYSVKSGYHITLRDVVPLYQHHVPGDWNRLWKVHTLHKACNVVWRIFRGCIPSRAKLIQRHVPCTNICPCCDKEEETDWHPFVGCEISKKVGFMQDY